MNVTATLITQNATHDDLSDEDYRDIFTELRQAMSLDKLCVLLGSAYSKAQWSKYEHGQADLTRTMRQELRAAVDLPPLALTIVEALKDADPDAEVWRIGNDVPDRIIVTGRATRGTIFVNGSICHEDENDAKYPPVTVVTRATRKPLVRPVATPAQNQRRLAAGATWTEIIEAGLNAMEMMAI